MKANEAVRELELMAVELTGVLAGVDNDSPMGDIIVKRIEAINEAQVALLEKEQRNINEPLTVKELSNMRFEPIFIRSGDCSWWDILYNVLGKGDDAVAAMGYGDRLRIGDYGYSWIAYRHKF